MTFTGESADRRVKLADQIRREARELLKGPVSVQIDCAIQMHDRAALERLIPEAGALAPQIERLLSE